MSSIERMQLVDITGHKLDLDIVLRAAAESGCFHIESASKLNPGGETNSAKEENPYSSTLKLLEETAQLCGLEYVVVPCDDLKGLSGDKLRKNISVIRNNMLRMKNEQQSADKDLSVYSQALTQVEHLAGLKVDFQKLFSCKNFRVRFGRLPSESRDKLVYYENKPFLFVPLSENNEYCYGVVFSPKPDIEETDRIFESLYFERIRVPDFVRGTSEEALGELKNRIDAVRERRDSAERSLKDYTEKQKNSLCKYYTRIKELHDGFELRSKAVISGSKFYLVGFVPDSRAKSFKESIESVADVSVSMKPSDERDKISPPIKLKNGKFSEPFGMFVEMYGLPSYNGINPTTLVAVTYTLLFGIMFGDLGQGICVAIIGALLWKFKKVRLGAVMTRLGISGAIFGTLFGSVFGNEELLDPVYESLGISFLPFKSMHNINTVLYGAIGIGVFIIILTMIVNIVIKFKDKEYGEAFFSNNGIAGLVFFIALVGGLVTSMMGLKIMTGLYTFCLIIVPIVLMFMREPLGCWVRKKPFHMESGVGDFIASNFFECFEFLLGYATNTLSFVRVGGFVLSHAGMMAVVLSLSEMYSNASIIVMILGNIFVMGLEGMLVGIQVLRLEFYEIFSRFYDGDGRPFTPVRIMPDENAE